MKKRTRRRPARHFHPLGIVLLAALAISSSLALWTRAMDALSERDAFSAEDNAAPPDTAPVGNAQGGRFVDDYPFTLSGASHGAALTYGYLTGKYLAEERDV